MAGSLSAASRRTDAPARVLAPGRDGVGDRLHDSRGPVQGRCTLAHRTSMKQLSLPVKAKIRQSGRQRLAGAAPLPKTTLCLVGCQGRFDEYNSGSILDVKPHVL